MFFKKKQTANLLDGICKEDYDNAAAYAGGIGGYGHKVPKDKSGLKAGWWCPNCEAVYSPSVKECKPCNKANKQKKK